RAGPPALPPIGILALAALGVALILLGLGRLGGIAAGASRNLDAIIVTPAPTPQRQAATSLLTLPTVAPAPGQPAAPAPVTVLLLGSDRRPGEEATPRSDAIIVARVEPARGRVAILSLPRDLWVDIPGHGQGRVNAAYLWGEHDGPPGAGMALAKATVGDLLGVPIDYAAAVDFRGFIGLVDSLDGVTVDVEAPLVDDYFPTASYGVTTVRFAPGLQQMDGATALTYCRVRHPDDDFARHRRQQAVLLAIAARLRERGGLDNLLAAEHLSGALVGFVQTDMPRDQIIGLAWALRGLDLASVERYNLGEDGVTFGVENDRYALQARPGVIAAMARQLVGATP
ncbi:LCP family protein, partial [Oscillochloris sp. ZM17-4]|uniref:LCP family protein n=1 Tax=Oscillochloris sp. ZM17-4 TaxID=2866714 RepID=UPI001C734581